MTTYPYPVDSSHGIIEYKNAEEEEEDIVQLTEEGMKEVIMSVFDTISWVRNGLLNLTSKFTEEINRILREKQS